MNQHRAFCLAHPINPGGPDPNSQMDEEMGMTAPAPIPGDWFFALPVKSQVTMALNAVADRLNNTMLIRNLYISMLHP